MAACAATAFAAPPTYTKGDLLMGFRVTGGAGSGDCYLVNIGQAKKYRDATGPITVNTIGDINADLTAVYGANWQTRTDILWGIAGTPSNVDAYEGDPATTFYLSRSQATPGTPGLPVLVIDSETSRGTISTRMSALQSYFWDAGANPAVADHTDHSDVAAIQGVSSNNSWRSYMATGGSSSNTPGNFDFGAVQNIEAVGTKTLSLFRFSDNSAASYEGYFAISSTGVLTFTPFVLQTYSQWAAANVNGQDALQDFDHDGVANGIEFFSGGSSTAVDLNPQPNENGIVTWTRAAGRDSTPVVEVSTDLKNWTVPASGAVIGSSSVSYTFPTVDQIGPRLFVRLKVNP